MAEPSDRALCEGGFAFFGAITASLSHELNNVLATVSQLAGLLDDQAQMAKQGHPLDLAKLERATERIGAQIERGERFVKQLNRFAHGADHPLASLDGRLAVEEVLALCERFYRSRKVSLQGTLPEAPLVLFTRPFEFRHAVYRCLEIALATAAAGSTVRAELRPQADGVRLEVSGENPLDPNSPSNLPRNPLALLGMLAGTLGAVVESTVESGKPVRLVLFVGSNPHEAGTP